MINQSIHTIDLLYYLAGDLESVCAFADLAIHDRIEVEDNAALHRSKDSDRCITGLL